jgi:hypothetical protein
VLLLPVKVGKTGGGRPGPAKNSICFIMSRLKRLQVSGHLIFSAVAVAASVTLCAGGEGHAMRRSPLPSSSPLRSQAYLLRVGPPNLRYESAGPRENKIAPTRYALAESQPAKIEMPPPGNAVDAVAISSVPANAVPATPMVVKTGSVSPTSGLNAVNSAPGVTDQTVVTPEMLADYLKPLPGGNDGTPAVGAAAKLPFTLPTLMPDHSSRAVYKSE